MRRALAFEFSKMRKSLVVAVTTALIVVLVPGLCLGFVVIAERGGTGVMALKAQAMVSGEGWEAYLGLLGQMTAITLFIGPGVVAAWAFGREHADGTFPSLFAMPVDRGTVAAAKFVVLAAWGAALTALLLAATVLVGIVGGVGPMGDIDLATTLARMGLVGVLTALLALTVGYAASVGRGYLPAFGALILLTIAAQVAVLFGTGGWFPYAAPGLYAVAGSEEGIDVHAVQLLLVPLLALAVAWATVRWWRTAEVV
ncbi:MAG: ABC transporter permease [Actinobacteria bacterium]|nr:ABC transporter permease [Actinomycetota bacterium]